jgi:hypothetical protein
LTPCQTSGSWSCPFPHPACSWKCWTQDAADAAADSNLSLGSEGTQSVDNQMRDRGAGNDEAGHRRWLLYPWTRKMGVGSVDYYSAAASAFGMSDVWVFDQANWFDADGYQLDRPATREEYVAWPPPGYVPYQVCGRWQRRQQRVGRAGCARRLSGRLPPYARASEEGCWTGSTCQSWCA